MTTLHIRFPWIVSFGCGFIFLLVALVGTPIGNQVEALARLPVNSSILIQQVLLVAISALTVTVFGGWRAAGFAKPIELRALLLCLPPLAAPIILLFIAGFAPIDPIQLAMLIALTMMIGFAEEALCRGVMVGSFMPGGPMRAALYSSLIFGSMHLINTFYGMPFTTALLYAFYAALIGFGLAAPYIRGGGGIWPVILVHALYDLLGKLGHGWGAQAQPTTGIEVVVRLSVAILVAIYGVWLLKGHSASQATMAIAAPEKAVDTSQLSGNPKAG